MPTDAFIQGKNEQEIAHVCVAFAKQMRRRAIYACTASIGPGSLNMVTAAGTASVNRIPVLLLPSDTYADRQPDRCSSSSSMTRTIRFPSTIRSRRSAATGIVYNARNNS